MVCRLGMHGSHVCIPHCRDPCTRASLHVLHYPRFLYYANHDPLTLSLLRLERAHWPAFACINNETQQLPTPARARAILAGPITPIVHAIACWNRAGL